MTEMTWNSARFAEGPRLAPPRSASLRFASEFGTILRDLPYDYVPKARYGLYV
jgi:hypothetical protein